MTNGDALKDLVEWALARGLNVTALAVGDCRIELVPSVRPGTVSQMERGVASLYEAYAGDLVDDAFKRAHGQLDTVSGDLVPAVTE